MCKAAFAIRDLFFFFLGGGSENIALKVAIMSKIWSFTCQADCKNNVWLAMALDQWRPAFSWPLLCSRTTRIDWASLALVLSNSFGRLFLSKKIFLIMNILCKIFFSILKLYHQYRPTRIHRAMILSFMSTFCEICLTLEIQYSWRWKYCWWKYLACTYIFLDKSVALSGSTMSLRLYRSCGANTEWRQHLSSIRSCVPGNILITILPFSWAVTRNVSRHSTSLSSDPNTVHPVFGNILT